MLLSAHNNFVVTGTVKDGKTFVVVGGKPFLRMYPSSLFGA